MIVKHFTSARVQIATKLNSLIRELKETERSPSFYI